MVWVPQLSLRTLRQQGQAQHPRVPGLGDGWQVTAPRPLAGLAPPRHCRLLPLWHMRAMPRGSSQLPWQALPQVVRGLYLGWVPPRPNSALSEGPSAVGPTWSGPWAAAGSWVFPGSSFVAGLVVGGAHHTCCWAVGHMLSAPGLALETTDPSLSLSRALLCDTGLLCFSQTAGSPGASLSDLDGMWAGASRCLVWVLI